MRNANALVGSDIELMPSYYTEESTPAMLSMHARVLTTMTGKGEREDLGDGYWMHRDGFSIEYGFDPVLYLEQFMNSVEQGKVRASKRLRLRLSPMDRFSIAGAMENGRIRPEFRHLTDMGCSPDFLAMPDGTARMRNVPPVVRSSDFRECGGHIHIAMPPPFNNDLALKVRFVRELDAAIYPLAITSSNVAQRTWYRQRNLFRPTSYGIEYRSLGAEALFAPNAETIMALVFQMSASIWEV